MATTLRITLLSGRYGATPWDRSEFEGQVEYPPSPWRLLRAILHGAFLISSERDQLPEGVGAIVEALAASQPSYHLPFGEFGQIRGFRPVYGCEPVPPLDTFGAATAMPMGSGALSSIPSCSWAPARRSMCPGRWTCPPISEASWGIAWRA